MRRKTSQILYTQNLKTKNNNKNVIESLDRIKEFGQKTYKAFFGKKEINYWVHTLHEHWKYKKTLSDKISFNNDIKNIYRKKCLLD